MPATLRKTVAIGLSAVGLSFLAASAQANPYLPNVSNLNFVNYTGGAPKNTFAYVNPVGWTGGTGLVSIDAPGTGSTFVEDHGNAYGVWVDPGAPPTGGNYVQADGNPSFESSFSQTISGLTIGTTYTLSFYQAAGQQGGNPSYTEFSGATTEQWVVSLGTSTLTDTVSHGVGTPANADPTASIQYTSLMHTPSEGGVPWNYVSVQLTADATTDILSFLAWGDGGSTANLPPTVFLSGVNAPPPPSVPEPASLSLLGLGLVGLGGIVRRRRRANRAASV